MREATVYVGDREPPLVIRINGTNPTFQLKTDTLRAMARAEIDPLHLDILEIAATVFAADGKIPRGGKSRPGMGSGWHRAFSFAVPVRVPEFWNRAPVNAALVDAVEFLTGDKVAFSFTEKPADVEREPFLDLDPEGPAFSAEEVILFSGGLDSFAGALEVLSTTESKVILLTHRSAQKAITRQVELGQYLVQRFPSRVLHVHVLARRKGEQASDSSQRSRSFLFAALGQLVAKAFGAKRLSFYENGVISHNLPISPQVVGTMASRTTHPLSLRKLNTLMRLLGENSVPIENKYQWHTKKDIVERIANHGGEEKIARTVSCTSIREQTTLHTHCGECSQCLDRRFAILAAGLEAHDFATDYATEVLFGSRQKPQSRTMAVEWTRHALTLTDLDELGFIKGFGSEFSRIAEGYPGSEKKSVLALCLRMHARHGQSVKHVLEHILQTRSEEILKGQLQEGSLVSLLLGSQTPGSVHWPDNASQPEPGNALLDDFQEIDIVPDAEAPLHVQFLEEDGRLVVSIVGLCRLTGAKATIPDALKPEYLDAKSKNIAPDEHQYVALGHLALRLDSAKTTVRQRVRRCREELSDSYVAVHGTLPDHELLFQHKAAKGYRLDPSIKVLQVR